jgi:hypothetical protein
MQHKLDCLGACDAASATWDVFHCDSESTDAIIAEIFSQHVCAVTMELVSGLVEGFIMGVTVC